MRPRWQWRQAAPVSGHAMTSPGLREVHERLVRLGSGPVSDPGAAWQDLHRKLPERPLSWSGRLMAWLRRPAIAILTTGLLSTGVAHAAGVQPVRSGVDWLIGGVTSIVGAKSEARDEPGAHPAGPGLRSDDDAGPSKEGRRQLSGVTGPGHDRGTIDAPLGRGRPALGGTGAGGDEDRAEQDDEDRDGRGREDDHGDDGDDGDELERDDVDEKEAEDPDDEDLNEPDEGIEEPDDEASDVDRDAGADGWDDPEGKADDEVDPDEDRD